MDAPTSTSRLLLGHDYKGRYCPGRSHKGDGIWQPVALTKLTWGAGGVWAVTISIPKHFRGSQTEKRLTANGTNHVHSKTATTRHWSIFPKDHEITHSNRRDWNVFSKPRLCYTDDISVVLASDTLEFIDFASQITCVRDKKGRNRRFRLDAGPRRKRPSIVDIRMQMSPVQTIQIFPPSLRS